MEANNAYVQDYLKDNKNAGIGTHNDRNLGSAGRLSMFAASPCKKLSLKHTKKLYNKEPHCNMKTNAVFQSESYLILKFTSSLWALFSQITLRFPQFRISMLRVTRYQLTNLNIRTRKSYDRTKLRSGDNVY